MNRWVLLRSRQNFSLYSGGAVCVCDASKGCSKLVIYVQLNYFKLDLIIRSFLRRSRFHRVVGWIAWTLSSQIAWIESKEWVSEWVQSNDEADDVQFKGFKIWFFSLLNTPRARVNFQFNSEMKNRQCEQREARKKSDLKMKLLNCVLRVAEMLLIINFSIWTHTIFKFHPDMPHSRIFQFSYF